MLNFHLSFFFFNLEKMLFREWSSALLPQFRYAESPVSASGMY